VVKKVLEKDLEKYFAKECKRLSLPTLKLNVRFSRGWPDRLVASRSGLHLVELKTETGKLSALQERVIFTLGSLGVTVTVLRSKNQITEYLESLHGSH
jgi:hypothetical protein